ncbi:Marvel domain [Trinorchestia longiramus]|nr:Marvel domain [Trinorchestia longiramus]
MTAGFNCCCCRCCSCIDCSYYKEPDSWIKITQMLLSILCQWLCMSYGMPYSSSLGASYSVYLTTCSGSIITSAVLLITYTTSVTSKALVRRSAYEIIFHSISSFLFFSSSAYLSWAVQTVLWPLYMNLSYHAAYVPMSICYILGVVMGIIHAVEAFRSHRRR